MSKSKLLKMQQVVVDVQGFWKNKSDFILKEIAIFDLQKSSTPFVFTFKSPLNWNELSSDEKSTARWLENSFHGIRWSSGEILHEKIPEVMQKYLNNSKKIFVKGELKKKFLQSIFPEK